MAKFTDSSGMEWSLEITLADVPALKELGLDVEGVFESPEAAAAANRVEVLGRALWHLCEGQAGKRGVTTEAFARSIPGPVRWEAAAALEAAVLDFTLPPSAAAGAKARLAADRERVIGEAFGGSPGGSSAGGGNSAGSSGSTPGPSASGNCS